MSAKAIVSQAIVMPSTVQAATDAVLYVQRQAQLVSAAVPIAIALLAAGKPQGAPVIAVAPVITAAAGRFQAALAAAAAVAQGSF